MLALRRFLALAALFFWQGGFTFYAAIVVPIGQEVFTHRKQGFVTQRVTNYLNLAGAVGLVPLAWDVAATHDTSTRRRRLRALLWLALLLTLLSLVWLHPRLDALLDATSQTILDRGFRSQHRLYLWISTVQWGCAAVYLLLSVYAWRAEDQGKRTEVRSG